MPQDVLRLAAFLLSGDEGIRTLDLCSAIAALSQLSYIPELSQKNTTCGILAPFQKRGT